MQRAERIKSSAIYTIDLLYTLYYISYILHPTPLVIPDSLRHGGWERQRAKGKKYWKMENWVSRATSRPRSLHDTFPVVHTTRRESGNRQTRLHLFSIFFFFYSYWLGYMLYTLLLHNFLTTCLPDLTFKFTK